MDFRYCRLSLLVWNVGLTPEIHLKGSFVLLNVFYTLLYSICYGVSILLGFGLKPFKISCLFGEKSCLSSVFLGFYIFPDNI